MTLGLRGLGLRGQLCVRPVCTGGISPGRKANVSGSRDVATMTCSAQPVESKPITHLMA